MRAWLLAMILMINGAAAEPVRAPRPVLSNLQYEELDRFTEEILGDLPVTDRRLRIERKMRDILMQLAEIEPALQPRHRLAPFAKSLDAKVDGLADALVALTRNLRGARSAEEGRDLAAQAFAILALYHLTVGRNGGEVDEWLLRARAAASVILGGSLALVVLGLYVDMEVLWMKGLEGGLLLGISGIPLLTILAVRSHLRLSSAEASARRVAELMHRRFWARLASGLSTTTAVAFDPDEFVAMLREHGEDPLAICERALGSI